MPNPSNNAASLFPLLEMSEPHRREFSDTLRGLAREHYQISANGVSGLSPHIGEAMGDDLANEIASQLLTRDLSAHLQGDSAVYGQRMAVDQILHATGSAKAETFEAVVAVLQIPAGKILRLREISGIAAA